MELFVDGASTLTSANYIEKATRVIPYLTTDDGTDDFKAYRHFKALDADKSDAATTAIYNAYDEFF